MSKILYAYSRNKAFANGVEDKLNQICDELVPDNVKKKPKHKIKVEDSVAYAVTMSSNTFEENQESLLLGVLYEKKYANWDKPHARFPDGNYVLFRNDQYELEVVSDTAGSRTIWYYDDDDLFIASTSQRAIILFLGTFEFDEKVIPWMLSTGSLGPKLSWDKRLKRLNADSSIILNKETWTTSLKINEVSFQKQELSEGRHKDLLTESIRKTASSLEDIDFNNWVLPLSGGYDSRAILCFIKEQIGIPKGLKSVTWGLASSVDENGNDAKVAIDLAKTFRIKHEYYHTDVSAEPLDTIINRFIICSEGRIDHLSGYMDGMEIWKKFHDDGVIGVVRGDEGFGWKKTSSKLTGKLLHCCALCSDFDNLSNVITEFGLSSQKLPQEFEKREDESFDEWSDRLYHSYRVPTIHSALSDIKFSYVEEISPLLSKSILDVVRTIPHHLRADKYLFKKIVNMVGPDIPFANKSANDTPENILRNKSFVKLLKRELSSNDSRDLLGEDFAQHISDGIKEKSYQGDTKMRKLKSSISLMLPGTVKNWLRDNALSPNVDNNVLAFRVLIIIKMHRLLKLDALKLKNN